MNGRRTAATDWVGSGFGFWRLVGRRDRLIWEETRDLLAALTHFGSLSLTIERTAEGFGHIIRHFMWLGDPIRDLIQSYPHLNSSTMR